VSDIGPIIEALAIGIFLGLLFFGGLWWTVRHSLSSPAASVWLIGSFPLRMIITVGGFYFVSLGDWRRLLACLLGFLIARIGVTRLLPVPIGQKK